MKINQVNHRFWLLVVGLLVIGNQSQAQDSVITRVRNTFKSNLIIDNQTVMVPVKKTLEFDIQHRFGIVNNGYSDFYGLFAPPVIRLGFEYVPVKNLQFGFGLCSDNMQLDLNGKYAILKQTKGGIPVS